MSSMEELTITVKQNAENSILAHDLVEVARTNVERAEISVANFAKTMLSIKQSSNEISEITGLE